MKKGLRTVAAATMGLIIGSSMTVLAGTWVQAYRNTDLNISIDGQTKILTDATTGEREYPLTYNNRTYIPLRSVATLLGYNVDYDSASKTAIVNSPDYVAPETNKNPDMITIDSMNATDVPYLQGLKITTVRPKNVVDEEHARNICSNAANTLYLSGKSEDVHSQSPFKDSYKELSNIIDVANDLTNENVVSYYVPSDRVDVLYYVLDSNGVFRGIISSYDIEIKLNGNLYETKRLTSLFLNDENAQYYYEGTTNLFLFCDFINQ